MAHVRIAAVDHQLHGVKMSSLVRVADEAHVLGELGDGKIKSRHLGFLTKTGGTGRFSRGPNACGNQTVFKKSEDAVFLRIPGTL